MKSIILFFFKIIRFIAGLIIMLLIVASIFLGPKYVAYQFLLWYRMLVYDDIPSLEYPVVLKKNNKKIITARIVEERSYWLNLELHYKDFDEREKLARLLGLDSKNTFQVIETQFEVLVKNSSGEIVFQNTEISTGVSSHGGGFLARRIAFFRLTPDMYAFEITPYTDNIQLDKLKFYNPTYFLTYHSNAYPSGW